MFCFVCTHLLFQTVTPKIRFSRINVEIHYLRSYVWSCCRVVILFCSYFMYAFRYFIFCQANLTFHFLVKQLILQLDLSSSWAFGVRWSPSGNTLAYVGQTYLPFGYLLESFFGIAYIDGYHFNFQIASWHG